MSEAAWKKQSASLVEVQKRGTGLEKEIREILGWDSGSVVYDPKYGYRVQVDAAHPNTSTPECVFSITYTNPEKRGHSNENKFQLKVGELVLLKGAYPDLRVVLAIGGSGDAWLKYVLNAFKVFFDEVLFLWKSEDRKRLIEIGKRPSTVTLKHPQFWHDVHRERTARALATAGTPAPCCSVRYAVLDALKAQKPIVYNPSLISRP